MSALVLRFAHACAALLRCAASTLLLRLTFAAYFFNQVRRRRRLHPADEGSSRSLASRSPTTSRSPSRSRSAAPSTLPLSTARTTSRPRCVLWRPWIRLTCARPRPSATSSSRPVSTRSSRRATPEAPRRRASLRPADLANSPDSPGHCSAPSLLTPSLSSRIRSCPVRSACIDHCPDLDDLAREWHSVTSVNLAQSWQPPVIVHQSRLVRRPQRAWKRWRCASRARPTSESARVFRCCAALSESRRNARDRARPDSPTNSALRALGIALGWSSGARWLSALWQHEQHR